VDCSHLAEDRFQWRNFVNTVMNFQIPRGTGNFLTSFVTVTFPRGHLLPVQLMEDVNVEEGRIQMYNVSNGF
jgi:hypothetical protein